MIRANLFERLLGHLCREEDPSRRVDLRRRALLAAGAAGAVGCAIGSSYRDLVDAPTRTRGGSSRADVVVIGAGLAGLVAAYRLRQRGVAAALFEASARTGGRAFTAREGFSLRVELGGEFLRADHRAICALSQELGLHLVDLGENSRALSRAQILLNGAVWTDEQAAGLLRPLLPVVARDLAAIGPGPVHHARFTPPAEALDQLSLASWMERNGVSGPPRALIETAFASETGVDADGLSALTFLRAFGRATAGARLFDEGDRRYVLREGSGAVASALELRLGDAIQRGCALIALRDRPDGRVLCVFERGASTLEVDAGRVILALPFTQLRRCELSVELPAAKRRAIAELRYGSNAKVLVGLRGRPWRDVRGDGASLNSGGVYHESWDASRGLEGEDAVLIAMSGGRAGVRVGESNPEAQGRRLVDAVDVIYPGTADAFTGRAARMHWPSARYFEGSFAVYAPGDVTTLCGAEGFAVGRLHFAGEHTSERARGTMEGAVESGERAAREVLGAR